MKVADKEWKGAAWLVVKDASTLTMSLQISSAGQNPQELRIVASSGEASAQASGGGHLSSTEVSSRTAQ